ncbi:MAG: hypothetical protein ACOY93_07890 [Bacillota bacterium]
MQLADRDWILYCRQCREWTGLHRFLAKRGHFQGERSLMLNAYLNSDLFLGKFLIHHADHELVPIPDLSDEYVQTRVHRDRFLEGLIDQVVEERLQEEQDRKSEAEARRKEGYHTLLTLQGIYTERLKELDKVHPDDPGQARVHLGKTLGIEWCREQINHLLRFRDALD